MNRRESYRDPIEAAHGLSSAAYNSEAYFALEQHRLFERTWHAVGFAHDVAEPGDVYPVMSAAGRSLLLVRDEAGAVRVFHNFCRHRGMRLVDAPASGRRRLVCPYHAWSYALDGALQRIPHRHGYGKHEASPADVPGLREVASGCWAGVVFVDLSGEAGPLDEHVTPLARRWSHYDLELLEPDVQMSFDVPANWKLAIENFIDIYHVPYVHPGLNRYNDMTEHYFIEEGGTVLGEGNEAYRPADEGAGRLPTFPGLTDRQLGTLEAVCLFPNLLLTVFSDNLRAIIVQPTGPGACHERVSIAYVGEAAMTPELEAARGVVAERFPSFNREDVEVVTRLQRSFETSGFDRAHFNAFFDGNVHRFQSLVAEACGDGRG